MVRGHCPRQIDDGALGRRIQQMRRPPFDAGDTAHVHDGAAVAPFVVVLGHLRDRVLRHHDHARHVDLHRPGPRDHVDVERRPRRAADAHAVEQDVQPAVRLHRGLDDPRAFGFDTHVGLDGNRAAAFAFASSPRRDHVDRALRQRQVPVHAHHAAALVCEQDRRCPSVAYAVADGAGTRDNGHASVQGAGWFWRRVVHCCGGTHAPWPAGVKIGNVFNRRYKKTFQQREDALLFHN